jgi:hypothetical protein
VFSGALVESLAFAFVASALPAPALSPADAGALGAASFFGLVSWKSLAES